MINRVSEFAIYIGDEKYRGKGVGREAALETLRFAFYSLGLNRVFLKVLEENESAVRLYERMGFKKEGMLRKSVFKNNAFNNELLFGMLKEEFNEWF